MVLLDHDLNDAFLYDVVDSVTARIANIAQLIVLRKPTDLGLTHPLGKIVARSRTRPFPITVNCDPTPQHLDPGITAPDDSLRPVIFMRSSAALQISNWHEAVADFNGTHVVIVPCDPQGPLLDANDVLATDTAIIITNLASWSLMSQDRTAPFLTHEGRLRKLLVLAQKQQQLNIRQVPVDHLFMGYGGVSQVHLGNGETLLHFDLSNHVMRERMK